MTREDIFKTVDHTLLAQTATWEEIKELNPYCTRKWWNAPFPLKSSGSSL